MSAIQEKSTFRKLTEIANDVFAFGTLGGLAGTAALLVTGTIGLTGGVPLALAAVVACMSCGASLITEKIMDGYHKQDNAAEYQKRQARLQVLLREADRSGMLGDAELTEVATYSDKDISHFSENIRSKATEIKQLRILDDLSAFEDGEKERVENAREKLKPSTLSNIANLAFSTIPLFGGGLGLAGGFVATIFGMANPAVTLVAGTAFAVGLSGSYILDKRYQHYERIAEKGSVKTAYANLKETLIKAKDDFNAVSQSEVKWIAGFDNKYIDFFPTPVKADAYEIKLGNTIERAQKHSLYRKFSDRVSAIANDLPKNALYDDEARVQIFRSQQEQIDGAISAAVDIRNANDRADRNAAIASVAVAAHGFRIMAR